MLNPRRYHKKSSALLAYSVEWKNETMFDANPALDFMIETLAYDYYSILISLVQLRLTFLTFCSAALTLNIFMATLSTLLQNLASPK